MKRNLVALAALAFVGAASAQSSSSVAGADRTLTNAGGAASAQSSVTLWGVVDADVSHYSQGNLTRTLMSTSGNAGSQLGFRGTEDLGGGLSANFWLEAGLLNASGSGAATGGGLDFNRRSTVSLAGHFGEVRLGLDYTPSFVNHFAFDPFFDGGPGAGTNITLTGGANGAAGANLLTAVRASNSVEYLWGFAPNALAVVGRGPYAQLMYAFAGNSSGQPALGEYAGGRFGYASGPVNAAISYAQSKGKPYAADAAAGYSTYTEFNLGGSYNFGVAKLMAHIGTNDSDVAGTKATQWGVGAIIPAGQGYIPVSYNSIKQNDATSDGADQFAIGYVYYLSKRTALYATVSHINNKNNGHYSFFGGNGGGNPAFYAVPGFAYGDGTGYDVGLRTSF